MFNTGDYIHYSSSGLCCVEEITKLNMNGADQERLYYRLQPLDTRKGIIYTPVDNKKVIMRKALTRDEANQLITQIPDLEELPDGTDKEREQTYKNALHSADCADWVRVIKTVYTRREKRIRSGKKAAASEERYFNSAVEMLHQELALAVGIDVNEVEDYITRQVEQRG